MLVAMTTFILCSCDNDETIVQEENCYQISGKISKEEFWGILKELYFDSDLCKEVHSSIQREVFEGNDENVMLKKMVTSNSIKTNSPSVLKDRLTFFAKSSRGLEESKYANLLKDIENSNIEIYWPYSENWDGKELPTIVIAPDDEDVEVCDGWVISESNGRMQLSSLKVDERYAMCHPVWVIKENLRPQEVNTFGSLININNLATRSTGSNPVYPWKLTRMKVTHQYDTWIAGGSEIVINVVYPPLTGTVAATNRLRIVFTRKEINDETWKTLTNQFLNTNWTPDQINNFLHISEADDGGSISELTFKVQYTKDNKTVDATAKINIGSRDEQIGQLVINRDFIKRCNTLPFDNENVFMEMPLLTWE